VVANGELEAVLLLEGPATVRVEGCVSTELAAPNRAVPGLNDRVPLPAQASSPVPRRAEEEVPEFVTGAGWGAAGVTEIGTAEMPLLGAFPDTTGGLGDSAAVLRGKRSSSNSTSGL
jgi:hypothetical protein